MAIDKDNNVFSVVKDASVISLIERAPVIDLQTGRSKGYWEKCPSPFHPGVYDLICSVCGGQGDAYGIESPYCPWCGSEMKLTKEE
jgi:hypothetical protein